jgi:tetratricopeptide (TPR) repeat protein
MLGLVAIAVYALCLPNQMFWDDEDFILKNMFIKDWQFWPRFFTDNIIAGTHLISNYWRPLLQAIFAVEWHLWADWVWGWHAVSILMHAAAASMLFLVINILLKNRALAILTALLWLIHPVHTEAVVYPNSMGDSLATTLVFSGIYFYAQYRRSGISAVKSISWWLALTMYPLALLSKETGILLIAFIMLTDIFFFTTSTTLFKKALKIFTALWPFILIAAVYMALRATVLNFNNSFNFYNEDTQFTTHFDMRLATFFRVIALDAGFIFTPYDLRVERIITPAQSFFELDVLWGMALCGGLIALAVRNLKKRPAVAFGVAWFFTGILPTSNLLVIINAFVYEHFLYTSLAGIILIVLIFAMEWAKDEKKKRVLFTILITVICLAGIRSAWRCLDWRTAIGFYEKLAPTVPTSYRVFNNMGMAYAERGMVEKAKEIYRKAIAIDPTNAVSYHNIANIFRDAGESDLARQYYEKAIALQPSFIFSYKSLAQLYLNKNENAKARKLLEAYYNMTEEKVYTLNILTEIAYREGAYLDAKRYLLTLLKILPDDPATLAALQKLESAMKK